MERVERVDQNETPPIDLDTVSLLVPQAREGSERARSLLLEHVQDYVVLMARQRLSPNLQGKVGTSDVVQQSLAQVIQGFDGFRGTTAQEFYGWLNRIIANEVKKLQRDFHRDKRNVRREQPLGTHYQDSGTGFVPTDRQRTPGSAAIAAEQIALFHETLASLPADYAEVIRLRSLERLPFKEVAEAMNRSFDSVTKLWYRAILMLQEELGANNDGSIG